jgi:restriction system protein
VGAIWTTGSGLTSMVSEFVGFKTGVALSRDRMAELLADSIEAEGFFEVDDESPIRIRSEELEAIVHELLFRLGNTPTPHRVHPGIALFHRYRKSRTKLQAALSVLEEWKVFLPEAAQKARAVGKPTINPTPFLEATLERHGYIGARVAIELFEDFNTMMLQSPWNEIRTREWKDVAALEGLFRSESLETYYGQFFDQRFIDYLARNFEDIDRINWRKFEGLVGEYFHRDGFHVKLGPGRNDEGIDARVWPKEGDVDRPPAILVQCKRQKETIEKVVVKALYADVIHEEAKSGLIVTTSALSPGAKKVCSVRSYPIRSADRAAVRRWIDEMRSPGSGVFLGE